MLSLPGKPVRVVIIALFAGILAGCGGGASDDRPDRTPVSGSVSIGGVPVTGAIVVFSPATEGKGRGATGITDDSGNFVLGTFSKDDGAVPGDYVVLVSKLEQSESEAAEVVNEEDPAYDGAPAEEEEAGLEEVEAKSLIPAKFGKRESSTLTATVGDDAVEGLTFDLAG
ncbi:MAG: hypothetical protein ACKVII_27165 [Planctomycetales bacterium]|jgi:hypothetical protein